jgi:hypothetical protein
LCAEGDKQADVAYQIELSTATIKLAKREHRLFGDIEGGCKTKAARQFRLPTSAMYVCFSHLLMLDSSFHGTYMFYNNVGSIFIEVARPAWTYSMEKLS